MPVQRSRFSAVCSVPHEPNGLSCRHYSHHLLLDTKSFSGPGIESMVESNKEDKLNETISSSRKWLLHILWKDLLGKGIQESIWLARFTKLPCVCKRGSVLPMTKVSPDHGAEKRKTRKKNHRTNLHVLYGRGVRVNFFLIRDEKRNFSLSKRGIRQKKNIEYLGKRK